MCETLTKNRILETVEMNYIRDRKEYFVLSRGKNITLVKLVNSSYFPSFVILQSPAFLRKSPVNRIL